MRCVCRPTDRQHSDPGSADADGQMQTDIISLVCLMLPPSLALPPSVAAPSLAVMSVAPSSVLYFAFRTALLALLSFPVSERTRVV